MIYVRIELWPEGDRAKAELLQEVQISNNGSGDAVHGNYSVTVSHSTRMRWRDPERRFRGWHDPQHPRDVEVWRRGLLYRWRRDRSAVELVLAALDCTLRRTP